MRSSYIKNKKAHVIAIILSTIAICILAIAAWLTPWVWLDHSSKPLGDKLEYIGKKDYGCWLGYCDAKVGATYYYATDMSLEEVTTYFRGARLDEEPRQQSYPQNMGTLYRFDFYPKNDSKNGFYFDFYDNGSAKSKSAGLSTTKEHLIEMDYSSYQPAKDAL